MTAHIARTREARKPRVRSAEYLARKSERAKERRRMAAFAREQAAKTKAARQVPIVIQPSIAKRQRMQAANKPGETVEEFMDRGGRVDVLPGFAHKPGPMPARHYVGTGSRTP